MHTRHDDGDFRPPQLFSQPLTRSRRRRIPFYLYLYRDLQDIGRSSLRKAGYRIDRNMMGGVMGHKKLPSGGGAFSAGQYTTAAAVKNAASAQMPIFESPAGQCRHSSRQRLCALIFAMAIDTRRHAALPPQHISATFRMRRTAALLRHRRDVSRRHRYASHFDARCSRLRLPAPCAPACC